MKKIKGTTIIESVTALAIITTIFGISLLLWGKLSAGSSNYLRYQAMVEVQRIYFEALDAENPESETLEREGLIIEKIISENAEWKRIKVLRCSAFDKNGRLIYERKLLIPAR